MPSEPIGDPGEPLREEVDVEAQLRRPQIDRLFLCRQQVDQQCRKACLIEQLRDIAVARAVTTAAASVSKQNALGKIQIPLEHHGTGCDAD
jgi:hypothetical protein